LIFDEKFNDRFDNIIFFNDFRLKKMSKKKELKFFFSIKFILVHVKADLKLHASV